MGWLRDLMGSATPSVRSYDQLANLVLAHANWPERAKPQARSLAALFSKLDRNQQLEWLAERRHVQRSLASILRVPEGMLEQTVDRKLGRDPLASSLRLNDLPFARPLRLQSESLPPGIPVLLQQPEQWDRVFWHAPPGAGSFLVGRWLEARGLAAFVRAADWKAALSSIPDEGPLFIEIVSALDEDSLLSAPPRPNVCVAAPNAQPNMALTRAGWTYVRSSPAITYVDELLEWLIHRVPADASVEPARVRRWVLAGMEHGLGDMLDSVLGLVGAFHEFGASEVEAIPFADLPREFAARRLARVSRQPSDDAWLERKGWDLLMGLGRGLFTNSPQPWSAPRSRDEWVELMAEEHRRAIDVEWVQSTLARSDRSVTVAVMEKTLGALPPPGERVVDILCSAGILKSTELGFSLAPHWLGEALRHRVLATATPTEWGRALLRPHNVRDVTGVAKAAMKSDAERHLRDVLASEDPRRPERVAALELSFRMLGLAVLENHPPPPGPLSSLWNTQMELLIELDDGPHARLEYPSALVEEQPELGTGAWRLAALALSEHLPAHEGRHHILLRPWAHAGPPAGLSRILDEIAELVLSPSGTRWALETFALVSRMSDVLGALGPGGSIHVLELPSRLVACCLESRVPADLVERLTEPILLRGAMHLAEARGIDAAEIASSIWRTLETLEFMPALLLGESEAGSLLWRYVPLDTLERMLGLGPLPSAAYRAFDEPQWQLVLDHRRRRADLPETWEWLPKDLWLRALDDRLPGERILAALWREEPELLLGTFRSRLRDEPRLAMRIARTAPREWTSPLLVALADASARPSFELGLAVPWLFDCVRERKPSWENAFELLASLDPHISTSDWGGREG